MTPLLRVARVGRGEAGWLGAGMAVSVLAAGTLLALSVGSAGRALHPDGVTGIAAVLALPFMLRALGLGRVVLRYAERMVTHAATFRALTALRLWLFRGLAGQSAGGLGMVRAGDALSRLVNDVEALDGLYLRIAVPGVAALLLLPVLAASVLAVSLVSGAIVVVLFAAAALVAPWQAARATQTEGTRLAEHGAALRVAAIDAMQGLREVLAYNAADRTREGLLTKEAALIEVQRDVARRSAAAQAVAFLCSQAALLAVIVGGGPLPVLVPSVFLTLAAFELVGGMPRAGVLAGHAAAAAARLTSMADALPEAASAMDPAPMPSGFGLRFEAVTFRWRPDRPPVLDGLTLDIPEGARVAILGPSGAGKSTLAALALKVVRPEQGKVRLGGADIQRLGTDALRARFAWLSQTTHVFQDSVRANLLLGRPEAGDAELWAALDMAQLAERVRALPQGLDTWLGGGVAVSGGEARRLALARALLSPAPILILDEPAAGLDAQTEMAFFRTLNQVPPGRTIIMIVHRLTGVEQLDRIWRLSAGRAVAAAA